MATSITGLRSLLLVIFVILNSVQAAHVHVHQGHQKADHHSKEKVQDAWNSVHYQDGQHRDDFDHEAILGNRKDAKEYDELTADQSKQRLRLLVTKGGMDANRDGFVDSNELKQWILKSFKSLAEEDGLDRFEEEDLNQNGFVTWKEHIRDNFDIEDELTEIIEDVESQKIIAEDKVLWAAADSNHDGQLDRQEFPPFNSPEEYVHMHATLFDLTMKKRDRNQDGFLDFYEFILDEAGNIPDQKSETYITEKERFDKDHDIDKDGKLNHNEIMNWIIPDNDDLAEQEADHLIVSSDVNDDGKLSVQEIVDHHDIFVGSEATDYGEKLNYVHDEF
ncbi:Calumenin-A [Halotydeus destructor]|nr:Calumenin-A [Halotydeus destructor]